MSMIKLINLDKVISSLSKINSEQGNFFIQFLYRPDDEVDGNITIITYRSFIFNKINYLRPVILDAFVETFKLDCLMSAVEFMEYLDKL